LLRDNRISTMAGFRHLRPTTMARVRIIDWCDPGPGRPLRDRVEAFERAIIAAEFEAVGRNQSETARRLGVSRPALIGKLHKYGIKRR